MKKEGNYTRYAWNTMKYISISIVLLALAGNGQATLQGQQDDGGLYFFSSSVISNCTQKKIPFLAHSLFIFRHIFISDLQYINTSEEIVAYNTNIFMNNKL